MWISRRLVRQRDVLPGIEHVPNGRAMRAPVLGISGNASGRGAGRLGCVNRCGCEGETVMMSCGTGCLPDSPLEMVGDRVASDLLQQHGVPTRPSSMDYLRYVKRVYNQRRSSSCTGHAFVQAAGVRARLMGADVEDGSPYGAYGLARMKTAGLGGLTDTGARPRDLFEAMSLVGVPPRGSWPPPGHNDDDMDAWINRRMDDDWSAVADAFEYRLSDYSWVTDEPSKRTEVICDLVALGYPVTMTIHDDEFLRGCKDMTPMPAPRDDDTTDGLHYIAIVGYHNGNLMFVNSWGDNFGSNGIGLLSPERVAHRTTQSIAALGVSVY